MRPLRMTSFRKHRFLIRSFLACLFDGVRAVEMPEVRELSELEEQHFAMRRWIDAGLNMNDTMAFIAEAREGRAVRCLRMLEGAAKAGGGVRLTNQVLIHVDWRDLISKAVECGMGACPGAIGLIREMDQSGVDACLNRCVAEQMHFNADMALHNVSEMMEMSIRLSPAIAKALPDDVRAMLWTSASK